MAGNKKIPCAIRLPKETIATLTKLAKRNGVSFSAICCMTILEAYPLKTIPE